MKFPPDMAWRLNDILAFLHAAAIPSEHCQKLSTKSKSFSLQSNLLPFSVLAELRELEIERSTTFQPNRWDEPR